MEEKINAFSDIITNSPIMFGIFKTIEKVANTKASILITGDTGTGKELIAKAIWTLSDRKEKPLVIVNCGAIPDNLLESELFGYKQGAFTDAKEDKRGRIEEAHQGTLVLDEVAELSPFAQAKLLRVLENGELQRLGDVKNIMVDIRILALTNKNLKESVENKTFREDLFYRLSEFNIHMPPLRERKEDFPLLINHFIEQFNREFNKNVKGISDTALAFLTKHPFPGNVRELKSIIKRAMILIGSELIWLEHLPIDIHIHSNDTGELVSFPTLKSVEREHICKALQRAGNNKTKLAQLLGISRQALYEKLKFHSIKL